MENVRFLDEQQEQLIKTLKKLLAEAEAGYLHSIVAVVGMNEETGNLFYVHDHANRPALLGELRLLERDFIDIYFQTRRQPAW